VVKEGSMIGLDASEKLIVHSDKPYNAEPKLARLRASMRTAQADFYVRSHGNIPEIDATRHRLRVSGRVRQKLNLSMEDLRQRFQAHTVEAVLQCAGNRRRDMLRVKPVSGDPWAAGAIGNAGWTGARLIDVLKAAEAERTDNLHVAFDSMDDCNVEGHQFRYGVSIPLTKATSPEVVLAYQMNGEPLTAQHGAPLRVIVPGFAGVRSAKWLTSITVQESASKGYIQAEDYKLFPSDKTKETANPTEGMTINDMPLNSAICEPADNSMLKAGSIKIRGWAVATARPIVRVDVSADGGRHWVQAMLEHDPGSCWSWSFWETILEVGPGSHEIAVRAWDAAGQTQPALPEDTWNFKGYLAAFWHRIHVQVD
jgi:sulfite oxidase